MDEFSGICIQSTSASRWIVSLSVLVRYQGRAKLHVTWYKPHFESPRLAEPPEGKDRVIWKSPDHTEMSPEQFRIRTEVAKGRESLGRENWLALGDGKYCMQCCVHFRGKGVEYSAIFQPFCVWAVDGLACHSRCQLRLHGIAV